MLNKIKALSENLNKSLQMQVQEPMSMNQQNPFPDWQMVP